MPKRPLSTFFRLLRQDQGALFASSFLLAISLLAIFAFMLPLDPDALDISNMMSPPSRLHWFGTDDIGRDYFTRSIYGGRISLLVGLLSMLTSSLIGVLVGTLSGYFGGWVDSVLMRLIDVISSIPWMILVIVVSVFLKPGFRTIILVIGLFSWMEIARLVRAETLTVKEREYVLYARFCGHSSGWIICNHIIAGVFPTLIVSATLTMADAIMTESALSFLGLGIQQPMASWGSMLQDAQSNLASAPHMAFLPGILIVLTIFSFNKIGDLARLYMDPKAQGGGE